MIAVVCDTCVVNVNAAVDYRYVFVFINGHGYCVVNYFSNFYRNCVVTINIYFDSSCRTRFSGSSFHFQTINFEPFCTCDTVTDIFECYFIVVPCNIGNRCTFICRQCQVRFYEFKTAVQFQSDVCAVFSNCTQSITNCGFDFQFFDFSNFFCSYINCIFNRSFDTFAFYGSKYQVIAVCYCSVVGVNGYCSCFAFGNFVNAYVVQRDTNYLTSCISVHITIFFCNCNFEFSIICFFNIDIEFRCYIIAAIFYIDCVFVEFATFEIYYVVEIQCEFQAVFAFQCVSCCQCQLQFRAINRIARFDFINCEVFGVNHFSCCFEVASCCKCCCRNQRYDHSRSHYHGKKFFHGFIPPFKILFFVLCSFYNYTTKRISLCASVVSAARLKQLLWVRQSPLPIP